MIVDRQKNFKDRENLNILEKFADILGVKFDSIQALSELERFRRKNPIQNEIDSFAELSFLGQKFGIPFILQASSFQDVIPLVSNASPVAVFTNRLGWIFLTYSLGPFIRILQVSNSNTSWILKRQLKEMLRKQAGNTNLPEWILLDNSFFKIRGNETNHKDYLSSIRQIVELERKDIWAITIYSIAIGLLSLIIPIGVQSLVNILNFGTLFQPVLVLTLLVIIALSFVGLMNVLQSFIAELIQQRLFVRLAAKVTNLFPRIEHTELKKYYGSEIPNYFLDISIIQKSVTILLTSGIGIFLQTIIGFLVLALYHPIFILFDFIILGLVIGISFYLIGPVGIETSIKESKSKHKLASWLQEMNIHKTVFRSEKAHLYANLRTENLVREYIQSRGKHFKALLKQMIGFAALHALGSGLLLGIGGWLVIQGQITLGQLVAAEIIVTKILDNLGKFTKYLENYYDLCASLDKVNHLLDFSEEDHEKESGSFPADTPISVSVKNLRLISKSTVYSDLDFQAQKGEIVVIQDESVIATSTLIDLLFGLNPMESGSIEVDSFNLQDISISEWRNRVSILRDIEVFSGTIADNVKISRLDVDSSEIRKALEKVGLQKSIQELPEGIYTEILRNGYPFHEAELSALVFARSFLNKPGLVLIDGILKNLSKEYFSLILKSIVEEKKYSTFIIVSSIPDVLKIADRIYVIKDGKAIEKGKVKV